ncbi:MAG TPA: single-stranded DNA-binding protein [Candidatus Mcinerneyibacteriales bacterium]|jgi:single-strand DNA-binding protein|nr:single-stranded DNA-binding protein [Candidatus Mcinerneyibacteriales bacterium]HPJ70010.1 single-stranded DNA-binding protein [Candidatus Mcinerneyibacteriales bacterium]HPQ88873.1 single-stranded DNA-binding protein [Candidatus Mcinerneyibacteriales bacterium]
MAVSVNKVFIAGNITRDPEIRYTGSGKAVTTLTVAVNDYFSQEASFFRVVVWERQAENCQKYLSKGSPVLVEGRLQSRNYEVNGEKRNVVEIVAQNVQFLSSGSGSEGGGSRKTGSSDDRPEEEIRRKVEETVENNEGEFFEESGEDDIPF